MRCESWRKESDVKYRWTLSEPSPVSRITRAPVSGSLNSLISSSIRKVFPLPAVDSAARIDGKLRMAGATASVLRNARRGTRRKAARREREGSGDDMGWGLVRKMKKRRRRLPAKEGGRRPRIRRGIDENGGRGWTFCQRRNGNA